MKKTVAIIGGGTAGLFLAAFLNTSAYDVSIYEKKATLGRKFLVAGDGGFNLTHSEELTVLKSKYTPTSFLDSALDKFSNMDLRTWLEGIGIQTFVGSSGRVFPNKGIKPIEVLKAIEKHLLDKGVRIEYNKTLTSWDDNALYFNTDDSIKADHIIFALGGASWKVTGSEGNWLNLFEKKGIHTIPFEASNCAYKLNWQADFIKQYAGEPLKNISISINNNTQKGEAVITQFGLEGNAIYGLSPAIREALSKGIEAKVSVDFKPMLSTTSIFNKLSKSRSNISTALRKEIKLSKAIVALLKTSLNKQEYTDLNTLSNLIKNFPLKVIGTAPIDEAISTVGGIKIENISSHFELLKYPNYYVIGEMLDWDAPTGGYLIQACASMGVFLAEHINAK